MVSQFQNKNLAILKLNGILEVARLIRRNRRKHQKRRKVTLDQTKKVGFSEKL